MNIDFKAMQWATTKHYETNHKYDGKSYEVHLWQVVDIAKMFIHYIPIYKMGVVYAACWLHDTIEDCRVTYNDVKQQFGEEIAEIVYALTNEKGRTRRDRANSKYYEGIRDTPYATFVKLCDRIANIKYSLENGSEMFKKYQKEAQEFETKLRVVPGLKKMWDYMDSLLSSQPQKRESLK